MTMPGTESDTGTDIDQGTDAEEEIEQGGPGQDQTSAEEPDASSDDPAVLRRQLAQAKKDAHRFREQSKLNAKKAAQWDKAEKANMTELEKAQAAQKEAEERAAASQSQYHRMLAAATYDLPVELIDELGSGSEEEIDARAQLFSSVIQTRAQELAEEIAERRVQELLAGKGNYPGTAGNGRPLESLRPGGAPGGYNAPSTPEEAFRSLLRPGS